MSKLSFFEIFSSKDIQANSKKDIEFEEDKLSLLLANFLEKSEIDDEIKIINKKGKISSLNENISVLIFYILLKKLKSKNNRNKKMSMINTKLGDEYNRLKSKENSKTKIEKIEKYIENEILAIKSAGESTKVLKDLMDKKIWSLEKKENALIKIEEKPLFLLEPLSMIKSLCEDIGLIKAKPDESSLLSSQTYFGYDDYDKRLALLLAELSKSRALKNTWEQAKIAQNNAKKLEKLIIKSLLFHDEKEKIKSKNMLFSKLASKLNYRKKENQPLLRYILFIIELKRRKELKNILDSEKLQYNYSLEHLMPQSYKEHWISSNDCYDEADKDKFINSLGNLTLLKPVLNKSLANKSWQAKLNGTIDQPACLRDSALRINKEFGKVKLANISQWDVEWIKVREAALLEEFIDIWKLFDF